MTPDKDQAEDKNLKGRTVDQNDPAQKKAMDDYHKTVAANAKKAMDKAANGNPE